MTPILTHLRRYLLRRAIRRFDRAADRAFLRGRPLTSMYFRRQAAELNRELQQLH